jgi:hypothetical protein
MTTWFRKAGVRKLPAAGE